MIQRKKRYKACDPLVTINKIKSILEDIGIKTQNKYNSNYNFDSCRVFIANDGLEKMQLGTNGKAMNILYTYASAYGEFMERIQNKLFTKRELFDFLYLAFIDKSKHNDIFFQKMISEGLSFDFIYSPDETYISKEELLDRYPEILKKILSVEDSARVKEIITKEIVREKYTCAPFYCFNNKKIEILPIDIINSAKGSNGLCAGNTPQEAIIHGICEVFERYAQKTLFFKELTPPTIPISMFEDTEIFSRIIQFEKETGYNIFIKDCSLNIGLPVIGVLIINKNKNNYIFKLGSDPSPIIALERCLTEAFQGFKFNIDCRFKDINFFTDAYSYQHHIKVEEFLKDFMSGTGLWNKNLFLNKPSYPFNKLFSYEFSCDQEDLKSLTDLITSLNYDLYIRDVSFLGFPAYNIYIPGMSEVFPTNWIIIGNNKIQNLDILFNLKNSNETSLYNFTNYLENVNLDIKKMLNFNTSSKLNLNREYLLSIFFFRLCDDHKAAFYMNKYIQKLCDDDENVKAYYKCIRDYFTLLRDQNILNDIREILSTLYNESIVDKVLNDFSDRKNVLNNLKVPTCFNCNNCQFKNDCMLIDIYKIIWKLNQAMKKVSIDQMQLNEIFL